MSTIKENNRISQAFLNEYKGNIFEFLCAQSLARYFNCEESFLLTMPDNFLTNLSRYESKLKYFDPSLPGKLRESAETFKESFLRYEGDLKNVEEVKILGKIMSAETKGDAGIGEGDIKIVADSKYRVLSLKLCKTKSYVNTKSGGIFSFLKEYFNYSNSIEVIQNKLNIEVQKSYDHLICDLYELKGLEFRGEYDQQWVQAGYSELPGEQDDLTEKRIRKYYRHCRDLLFECLINLYSDQNHRDQFKKSLLTLCGYSNLELIQVKCFHENNIVSEVQTRSGVEFKDKIKHVEILKNESSSTSFSFALEGETLQIRIKPMNKFTTPGLKVNCSVKSN